MIFYTFISLLLFSLCKADTPVSGIYTDRNSKLTEYRQAASSLSDVEKEIRSSAVKVMSGDGHGTGNIFKFYDYNIIITANHVTSGELGSKYKIIAESLEEKEAVLVWSNESKDMSALVVGDFSSVRPMKFKKSSKISNIGSDIFYSGYPSSYDLLSFKGRVIGYDESDDGHKSILMNSYAWFGCSGSVVFNESGEVEGVLYAISFEMFPFPQMKENIVWISPSRNIDEYIILKNTCTYSPEISKKCDKYIKKQK